MRLLVAIAHHGTKNRPYLDRMLQAFREMTHEVDIVVLTEAEKSLPDEVEVRVGLPTSNPWSLPFAHRRLFVDRMEDYDAFLYTEDDTLVEQRHVDAYLELSQVLPEDHLPGLMRYEVDGDQRSMCTVHSYYRWEPMSVFRTAGRTFARLSNDHGACYLLTREQLRRAVASGGYALEPHEGRYDMLVSAATDPYTRCGFTKVFCLERLEDQLVHHLPNVYVGKLGIREEEFDRQVAALAEIAHGERSSEQLLRPEAAPEQVLWSKHVFPAPSEGILEVVPRSARRLLSLGCADGRTEQLIAARGCRVLGVPIDSVLATSAADRGVVVLSPSLDALDQIPQGTMDVVLALDCLQFLPEPVDALVRCRRLLPPSGKLVATVPDHRRYRWRNRLPGTATTPLPSSFEADGVRPTDAASVRTWFRAAGFGRVDVRHRRATRNEPLGSGGVSAALTGNTLLVIAGA